MPGQGCEHKTEVAGDGDCLFDNCRFGLSLRQFFSLLSTRSCSSLLQVDWKEEGNTFFIDIIVDVEGPYDQNSKQHYMGEAILARHDIQPLCPLEALFKCV